jgi:hypothetical protein
MNAANPRRWFRYSTRGLLIAVTLFGISLGREIAPIRERHTVVRMLEARGGVSHGLATSMFPRPEQSSIRRLLGEVPLQKTFLLAPHQGFTNVEMMRIQRAFPEARVKVEIASREGQAVNSMERWPTAEENRRERDMMDMMAFPSNRETKERRME